MSLADGDVPQEASAALSGGVVRVKLYVHGGTIGFSMRWSSGLPALMDHFTKNLQPNRSGIVVDTPERLIHIRHGSVSAYEFAREPLGSGSTLAEVRPA